MGDRNTLVRALHDVGGAAVRPDARWPEPILHSAGNFPLQPDEEQGRRGHEDEQHRRNGKGRGHGVHRIR